MGSLNVEKLMKKIYFANVMFYGYLFVVMSLLLKTFVIDIWVGEEYFLSDITVCLIIVELCLRGIHFPLYITRTAMGLFSQLAWIGPISALINICLDFVLGRFYGIPGIVTATIIARLITRATDVYVLYKYKFRKNVLSYYVMHIKYLIFILMCTAVCKACLYSINGLSVIWRFIFSMVIISVVYIGLAIAMFRKNEEFIYYYNMIKNKCKRKEVWNFNGK
jgi:hypothetical protein